MAKNKAQNYHDDRNEGRDDTREASFQCEINKDERLGFVAEGGVIFEGFDCDQGRCTLQGICG